MSDNATPIVGTRVVCYTIGPAATMPFVRVALISKVNPKTFRVDNEDDLFDIATWSKRTIHSRMSAVTRHVVLADSDEGRKQVAGMRDRKADRVLEAVYHEWRKDPTLANLELLEKKIASLKELAPKYGGKPVEF